MKKKCDDWLWEFVSHKKQRWMDLFVHRGYKCATDGIVLVAVPTSEKAKVGKNLGKYPDSLSAILASDPNHPDADNQIRISRDALKNSSGKYEPDIEFVCDECWKRHVIVPNARPMSVCGLTVDGNLVAKVLHCAPACQTVCAWSVGKGDGILHMQTELWRAAIRSKVLGDN